MKKFDKIQHLIMIKSQQARSRREFLPSTIRSKAIMSILMASLQYCTGGFDQSNQARKGSKGHLNWKEIKLFLLKDMIAYIESSTDPTKKNLLKLISEFSKVAG